MFVVAALYKFFSMTTDQVEALRLKLKALTTHKDISGTLLLASEGINGTVAGSREAIDALRNLFIDENIFADMEYKESHAAKNPFHRMKVKIKKEIVTLGEPEARPSEIVGTYVDPHNWNNLLKDPDVIVLDVRNDYEVELGTFKNSLNPKTQTFREFPRFVSENLDKSKHKKIAMSCTGGIRCEKASSYMKKAGFSEVYHLKGGILKYLEQIPASESLFEGECFVFDNRVSVAHGLEAGTFDLCHGCGFPITSEDQGSDLFQKGICCPRCFDKRTKKQKASARDRQKQMEIAKNQGRKHLGARH
jgi:UPF0176 protein